MPEEILSSNDSQDPRPRIPGLDADATPLIGCGISLIGLLLGLRPRLAAWPLAMTAAVALLYRDPDRITPQDQNALFAPADGALHSIDQIYEHRFLHTDATRLTIHTSLIDVPVQRSPVIGRIAYLEHVEPSGTAETPSLHIGLQMAWAPILLTITAGPIGQQVLSRVQQGESVSAGQRLSIARFGAQVALLIPSDAAEHFPSIGTQLRAGQTRIGQRAEMPGFSFQ